MKQKPNLPFWSLWNLSFGFFGVQIAYALQSANIYCRNAQRQDVDPFWSSRTLFIYRCSCCGTGDVSVAQCWFAGTYCQCSHAVWTDSADVPRYQYQYGHAAL